MKEIYLAGGCFWGMQAYFEQLQGIVAMRTDMWKTQPTKWFAAVLPGMQKPCIFNMMHS